MTYSMSTNIKTRRIVWTLNNGTANFGHPVGLSAFAIAGQFGAIWKDDVEPVTFE